MIFLNLLLATAVHAADCGPSLAGDVFTPRALKLKPKVLAAAHANPEALKVLRAFDRVFDVTANHKNLGRIAQQLLEPNEASFGEREAFRQNAYFTAHPESVTDLALDNLAVLKPLEGLDLDDFAMGLLATLLPAGPKAFNGLVLSEDLRRAEMLYPYLDRPEFRFAVANFLHAAKILNMYSTPVQEEIALGAARAFRENQYTFDDVQWAFEDLCTFGTALTADALKADLLHLEVLRGVEGATRRSLRRALDVTIRRRLPGFSDVMELQTLLCRFGYLDPLPPATGDLRRAMTSKFESWILPLKAAVNHARVPAPPAKVEVPKGSFAVADLFAPEPVGHKRHEVDLPPWPSETGWSLFRSRVPDEGEGLSSYWIQDSGRTVRDLAANRPYAFWVAREHGVKIQSVELSEQSLAWMKDHEREGRALLKALHFGLARGDRPGLLPIFVRPPGFRGGRFHRLRTAGTHSGIAIKPKDVWRIVTVAPDDEVEDVVRSLRSL